MKIQYLGTAAAEAVPAIFCQCPACEHARKELGKNYRSRSAAVIDDTLLIDFPPDIFPSSIRAGLYLPAIRDLVFTHSHEDHCDADELATRLTPVTCKRLPGSEADLEVWGNEGVMAKLSRLDGRSGRGITLHRLKPFEPQKSGDITFTALPADHMPSENCYVYLIEKDGKRFLYGNDTGIFRPETMDYLRGKYCDAISLDCTFVMLKCEKNHMGIEANAKLKNLLIEQGTADEHTKFIAHHFSHNGFIADGRVYTTEDFEAEAAKYGFDVSYDTMTFEI